MPLRTGMGAAGALAVAALLASCGGGGAPNRGSAKHDPLRVAVAYAHCMRSHGVPDFPDPNGQGDFRIQPTATTPDLDPNSPAMQGGLAKCGAIPTTVTAAQENQAFHSQLKTAVCMRANGVPNYPIPKLTRAPGGASASIDLDYNGIDVDTPVFQQAAKKCGYKNVQMLSGGR
jgi:hypothetical protein